MTERAERLARLAARQSIGRKSQIAANARPPAPLCAGHRLGEPGPFACQRSFDSLFRGTGNFHWPRTNVRTWAAALSVRLVGRSSLRARFSQAAEEAAREQVADREDHPAMIPAHQTAQARSSNQALQGAIE